jgi:hypothetical protein
MVHVTNLTSPGSDNPTVRRPTIAALAALPAAINAAKGGGGLSTGGKTAAADSGGSAGGSSAAGGGVTAVETGKNRVAMSVSTRVDSLRLVLLLDDAEDDGVTPGVGCLAEAKVGPYKSNSVDK